MINCAFDELIGKVLLIGLTYYAKDGEFIEQKQLWGTVTRADMNGIVIKKSNGDTFILPPDLSSFSKAAPGIYRLRSTGEVIEDPDYLTTWTVNKHK